MNKYCFHMVRLVHASDTFLIYFPSLAEVMCRRVFIKIMIGYWYHRYSIVRVRRRERVCPPARIAWLLHRKNKQVNTHFARNRQIPWTWWHHIPLESRNFSGVRSFLSYRIFAIKNVFRSVRNDRNIFYADDYCNEELTAKSYKVRIFPSLLSITHVRLPFLNNNTIKKTIPMQGSISIKTEKVPWEYIANSYLE